MKKGFTLVELSIVLVIIGLLIGGILVGQSLIESAKINRLVSNLGQYEVAVTQFYSKFKQYPGDSSYFSPPGAPDKNLSSGDTNGDKLPDVTNCNGSLSNWESSQVWAHLSQAKMLTKNYPSYSPSGFDSCPSGIHSDEAYNGGVISPYTELKGAAAERYGAKRSIFAYKNDPATNFFFSLTTNPSDTLSLQSKLSASSYDSTDKQVGLVNYYGLNTCNIDGGMSILPCTDPTSEGQLYYYLAPQ